VAAGYADGYMRSLGNRGEVAVEGHKVKVVGRVSMDLLTIDVTDLPDGLAVAGGFVELVGPNLPPDEVAVNARTNGYEILTNLGDRYHRVYSGVAS
jgi:alanine racemase